VLISSCTSCTDATQFRFQWTWFRCRRARVTVSIRTNCFCDGHWPESVPAARAHCLWRINHRDSARDIYFD